jgi:hypothetical protein
MALILAAVAVTILVGMWFEFGERHRFFLTPLILIFAVGLMASQRRPATA